MTDKPTSIDGYAATLPDEVRPIFEGVRDSIRGALPGAEERIRYDMPAIRLNDRDWLHFAAWKKHIGLYPVHALPEPLEGEISPFRTHKDTVRFIHGRPVPFDLIRRLASHLADEDGSRLQTRERPA